MTKTFVCNTNDDKLKSFCIMPSMFTVVSWLPVPLVYQVTGPRATTVNIGLTVQVNII